ncbi:hypothetical protein [Amycolatopsis sp. lyj-84]|uniref:hypothetical protein n=1 Tax=Amycolatopsis sp. lyj-84 TaxID=2789284 RepID=UPI00397C73FE
MSHEDLVARLVQHQFAFSWPAQASQYPSAGDHGIRYFKGVLPKEEFGSGAYVNCLLFRDESGVLTGILNHYPQDMVPYVLAGEIAIQVRPDQRRAGIATRLLREALTRWTIDLHAQRTTPDGQVFLESFLAGENTRLHRGGRRG